MLKFSVNLRLSLSYIALFAGIGIHLPFFPLWLASQGLEANDRAVILAVPMFIRVFALSFLIEWGLASGTVARAIALYALAAAVLTSLLPFQPGMLFVAVFAVLSSLAWMPVLPLLDATAMSEMRAGRADYGRARLWGSIAFMVMALAGGALINAAGVWAVIPTLSLILLSIFLSSFALPEEARLRLPKQSGPRVAIGDIVSVSRGVLFLFLAGALVQASHAVFYVQGSVHLKRLGYSETAIGGLWMVAVIVEVIAFLISKRIVGYFEPRSLLLIAAGGAVVRWAGMGFDPPTPVLVFLQALHALSFAATHIATTWLIGRLYTGSLAARAQGLYASLLGATNAIAMMAAGPLYAAFAGKAQIAMAIMAAIAFGFAFFNRPAPLSLDRA